MPSMGIEPTISSSERPKTYALDRAATGTGNVVGLRVEKPNIRRMLVGKQTHRTRRFGKRMRTTQFCGEIKASNAFL
jgi:hypothetical protein